MIIKRLFNINIRYQLPDINIILFRFQLCIMHYALCIGIGSLYAVAEIQIGLSVVIKEEVSSIENEMKLLLYSWLGLLALIGLMPDRFHQLLSQNQQKEENTAQSVSDFEKAVEIIKKYETLHQPRHWPLVGYGHMVLPGEKFSRTKAMNPQDAEALLRKDLLKNCAVFREFGADSLILGVLAYNIGSGAVKRSSVYKKLKEGNRDIFDNYVAHSKYRGKTHSQIKRRRIEEFETLFIKDLNGEGNVEIDKDVTITEKDPTISIDANV